MLRLLQVGGLNPAELAEQDVEHRDRRLAQASRSVTKALREVWSQGRGDGELPAVSIRLSVGENELRVMVETDRGHDGFPESRSLGFQWYLTFYLTNALAAKEFGRSAVLLFDEPGIHLHPAAQRDLLRRLNDIGEDTQIIFTTHLPDLVDLERPESWRVVKLSGESQMSTSVDNEAYRSPEGRIGTQVIRGALFGQEAGLGLPHWPRTLVVEGPADQVIIDTIARILARTNDGYARLVNGDVYVLVAHGLKNYKTFISIASRPEYKVIALFDSDTDGNSKRKDLIDSRVIDQEACVSINDAWDTNEQRDIEDLLGFKLYHDAVLKAYGGVLPEEFSFTRAGLSGTGGLGGKVKRFFEAGSAGPRIPDYDKWLVACAVRDILAGNSGALPEANLDRFKALLDTILGKYSSSSIPAKGDVHSSREAPLDAPPSAYQRQATSD